MNQTSKQSDTKKAMLIGTHGIGLWPLLFAHKAADIGHILVDGETTKPQPIKLEYHARPSIADVQFNKIKKAKHHNSRLHDADKRKRKNKLARKQRKRNR